MTLREAAQQALEALEHSHAREPIWKTPIKDAITALRAALLFPGTDYERGFIDGMSHQAKSSVDRAVNAMAQTKEGI
jgi:hypothetical protein